MHIHSLDKKNCQKYGAISVLLIMVAGMSAGSLFAVQQASGQSVQQAGRAAGDTLLHSAVVVSPDCPDVDGDGDGDGAIIGNAGLASSVIMGIDCEGQLNIPYRNVTALGLPEADPAGVDVVGLRNGNGTFTSTEQGCVCEGWGLAINDTSPISGWANNDEDGGNGDLTFVSFSGTDGGTSATSVVQIGNATKGVLVTHTYSPSLQTPNLYLVSVTLENNGASPIADLQYLRLMDWDIDPTAFNEFVTHRGVETTTQLLESHDNGFSTADPLNSEGPLNPATLNVSFEDNGPSDHGSYFRFEMGPLAVGEIKTFKTFYGDAPNQAGADAALAAVGAELSSYGQNNDGGVADDDGSQGPTFIFAFGSVGGTPIFPQPSIGGEILPISMTSLFTAGLFTGVAGWTVPAFVAGIGASIAALIRMRRRKAKTSEV